MIHILNILLLFIVILGWVFFIGGMILLYKYRNLKNICPYCKGSGVI